MTTFASRVKARIVGIGRDGEELTLVVPKPDKFISIKWHVLGEYLKWALIAVGIFMCGVLAGLMW